MRDNHESLIFEFEERFEASSPSRIDSFKERALVDQDDLLRELVLIELELRIKSGESARAEGYLERYPDLNADNQFRRELIQTELKIRSRYETGLVLQEYVLRFPDDYECLIDVLSPPSSTRISPQEMVEQIDLNHMFSSSDEASRFRRTQLLQQGGLGNIWAAEDRELGRQVAIKEIKNKYADEPSHQVRFVNEAIISGALEHPGIVPIYGMGQFRDNRPYYAMQLIPGHSFQDAIEEYHTKPADQDHPLKFRRLLQHFINLCNAIEYAHHLGVIHRDIKPRNVMIGEHGQTVVVDWGLAAVITPERFPATEHLLAEPALENQVVGSPAYMSPEQSGVSKASVAQPSDIYNLGATLLCIVAGTKNPNRDKSDSDLPDKRPIDSQVPRSLQPLLSICKKAMQRAPEDRYADVASMTKDVERFLADEPLEAHPETWLQKLARFSRKRREWLNAALVASFLIALVAITAVLLIQDALRTAQQERDRTAEVLEHTRKGFDAVAKIMSIPGACGLAEDITLAEGVTRLRDEIKDLPPPVQAMMYQVSAQNYSAGLKIDSALRDYDLAIRIADQFYGKEHLLALECKVGKAVVVQLAGDFEKSETLAEELMETMQKTGQDYRELPCILHSVLAVCKLYQKQPDEALQQCKIGYQAAIEFYQDPADSHCVKMKAIEVGILRSQEKFDQAQQLCDELLSMLKANDEEDSNVGIRLLTEQARIMTARSKRGQGRGPSLNEVIAVFENALEKYQQKAGETHLNSRMIELEIAVAKYKLPDATVESIDQAIASFEQLHLEFTSRFPRLAKHAFSCRHHQNAAREAKEQLLKELKSAN